jgi:hypothetical protein
VNLKDEETYCPLEEVYKEPETGPVIGQLRGSGSASCPANCTCYVRTLVETVIVDCQHAGN